MSNHLIVSKREYLDVLARRRVPFAGYVPAPEKQAAGLRQLREDFGGVEPLGGVLLSESQLVASAERQAADLEREADERAERVVELERETLAALPLAERFADYPATLRLLGLDEPVRAERPASALDRADLGPEMARLLGRRPGAS